MSNESPKQFELEYSNYAQTNLKDIARNIYEFTYSVISASNTTAKIMHAIELLPYQPFMGIKSKITGRYKRNLFKWIPYHLPCFK